MKTDLLKENKSYYSAKTKPGIEEFFTSNYISIIGKGDPDGKEFAEKIQALYPVAYSIKFYFKGKGQDYTVPKLEGLWWFDEEKYKDVSMEDAPKLILRE